MKGNLCRTVTSQEFDPCEHSSQRRYYLVIVDILHTMRPSDILFYTLQCPALAQTLGASQFTPIVSPVEHNYNIQAD